MLLATYGLEETAIAVIPLKKGIQIRDGAADRWVSSLDSARSVFRS